MRPGAGWSITSVFRRLMVSPKALAASDRQLASSCRSGSFTATRAQSSAKRKSISVMLCTTQPSSLLGIHRENTRIGSTATTRRLSPYWSRSRKLMQAGLTTYSIKYSIIYSIKYSIVYSIKYIIIYSIKYSIIYSIIYSIKYKSMKLGRQSQCN